MLSGGKKKMISRDDSETTRKKREKFLSLLAVYGNVSKAARGAKLNRTALYDFRKTNDEFAALWDEMESLGVNALEDEARRRAFEGTLKDVFYKGAKCGRVREYSDTLMIVLLKAHKPEKYRDNVSHEVSGKDGGEIKFRLMTPEEAAANDGG